MPLEAQEVEAEIEEQRHADDLEDHRFLGRAGFPDHGAFILHRTHQAVGLHHDPNEVRCTTPYLDEASVKERFTVAVNQLLAGRDAAIAAYELGMAKTLDTTALEAQQQELLSEMEVLNGMIQQMIRQNATVAQDQTEYNKRFDALSQKFKEAEAKKDTVAQQISDVRDRRGTMEDFLRILKQQDGDVTAFSEKLWCGLLDYATAHADGRLTFTFKNGSTFEG